MVDRTNTLYKYKTVDSAEPVQYGNIPKNLLEAIDSQADDLPKTSRGKNSMQGDEQKLTKKVIGSMTAVIPSEKNADTDQTPKK
jgi:hypothetical protein